MDAASASRPEDPQDPAVPAEGSSPRTVAGVEASPPPQDGPLPLLAALFAEQMARQRIADDGGVHHGAMPDVLLDPAHVEGPLLAELDRMSIEIPRVEAWGTFHGIEAIDGGFAVLLDDDRVEIPADMRLHVTERAYRQAGGADVRQYPPEEIERRHTEADPAAVLFEARDDEAPAP
ncbi:hypothetical protein I8D64_09770 [Brachybacterium sp. MASK1Z-5]|uniref:Uncharacterized protein n=1 Tax=Brachybacterium halotolerans TaxID=2795215 RepID=A0ABS1BCG4_9MICO|nr:hypothetical protein [Brachybacterium halotolerans]MBK0331690.1 hypothetical protein [Brachybacterium halotolerans]